MALPETSETPEKKSDGQKGSDKKEKLATKVVIRRLPPSMDQETFLNQISPVPSYDYLYMVKGDASLGENSFSRAYINFSNPNDIYDFKEKFDNYVFLDSAGHEYPAVVEFAAFQKIPKRRTKIRVDPKVSTIETDPYYLEFIEMINKPPEPDEKPEYSYQITDNKNEANEITPLLEYVKNKRVEKMRIREERREERKRKEFERKKFRDDDRKKRYEERSPVKNNKNQYTKVASPKEKTENKESDKPKTEEATKSTEDKTPEKEEVDKYEKPAPTSYYKGRDKKYDDRKKDIKNKYVPKKEYVDKREFKSRREDYKDRDYRSKYDDYKKEDAKVYQKKVKKYSEKREERKIEAQKAEQKKLEQQQQQETSPKTEDSVKTVEEKPAESSKKDEEKASPSKESEPSQECASKNTEKEAKCKEGEIQSQRRIRNKDRPTIAIYRPGMLSKRKQTDGDPETKENKKE
ncbi:hypothetical protein Zmor_002182 [Zophobas morio]|uniref:UPF3 domain-containing protein n=1 Tax=Zophobas morio TaxID=2755281 RepID=A0AA38J0J2_9CUCU|nr:hypothetical protein Zmor_002182 [Zophobas morio]